jgi:hypothetical protein
MGDNVATLKLADRPVTPVDESAVSLLRELLDRAERGEIQGVCIATIESDGAGSVVGAGSAYAGEGVLQNVRAALGAIEALKVRFIKDRLDEL